MPYEPSFDPCEPPRITLLADHPILHDADGDDDGLKIHPKLASVFDVLRHKSTRAPMAIAIYGTWGTGKSSAMRWLQHQLRRWNERWREESAHPDGTHYTQHAIVQSVWFDPWKYHSREDVWRGLIAEIILHCLNADNLASENAGQRLTQAARQFGRFLGRSFLHALSRIKISGGTGDVLPGGKIELSGEVFQDVINEYNRTNRPEKAFLNEFEDTLKTWVQDFFPEQSTEGRPRQRLAVFIDDLDRCLPEVALEVLEALKLYLNIPSLIFVVGLDREVVDAVVRKHYKDQGLSDTEKSDQYLDKMFQMEVDIAPSEQQSEAFLDRQIAALDQATNQYWSQMLQDVPVGEDECSCATVIRDRLIPLVRANPRETKRLLNTALQRGHAAVLNDDRPPETEPVSGTERLRFAQGVQVFLIQRILEFSYRGSSGVMRRNDVQQFFSAWSDFIQTDGVVAASCRNRLIRGPAKPTAFEKMQLIQRVVSGTVSDSATESQRSDGWPPDFEKLLNAQPTYVPVGKSEATVMHVLRRDDIWELMQIPFSQDVAASTSDRGSSSRSREGSIEQLNLSTEVLNAVAQELGKPADDMVSGDFLRVTVLNLMGSRIKTLNWVDHFGGLQELWLSRTHVSDLAPLAGLTALQRLALEDTPVSDLAPLAGLTALKDLWLEDTPVSDLAPLAGLTGLESLSLRGTQVSDLTPLAGLTGLQQMLLNRTQVSNLAPLVGLIGLEQLSANMTQVSDLAPLAGLTGLQSLLLHGTQVSDLAPLAGLSGLQSLSLHGTQVSDLAPLAGLTNLQSLSLDGTQVSDVAPLGGLTALKELTLRGTQVSESQILTLREELPRCEIAF